jgi:hypothetical protein
MSEVLARGEILSPSQVRCFMVSDAVVVQIRTQVR